MPFLIAAYAIGLAIVAGVVISLVQRSRALRREMHALQDEEQREA